MQIKRYLTLLIEEKGHQLDECILEDEGHIGLTWQMLIDFIEGQSNEIHQQIRSTLVMIDFKNGDVFHFLLHCARGMVESLGLSFFQD